MASSTPAPHQTWQAATALAATSIASLNLSLSFLLTPRLLELPTPHMLTAWKSSYKRTAAFFPPSMIACGVSYAALAGALHVRASDARARARLLAAAAGLCFSVVPWTKVFMLKRLNAKILELAARVEGAGVGVAAEEAGDGKSSGDAELSAQQEESAKWLVDQWGLYNLGRGIPVLAAGALGVLTLGW